MTPKTHLMTVHDLLDAVPLANFLDSIGADALANATAQ